MIQCNNQPLIRFQGEFMTTARFGETALGKEIEAEIESKAWKVPERWLKYTDMSEEAYQFTKAMMAHGFKFREGEFILIQT